MTEDIFDDTDASAVYKLAERPDRLGRQVKEAIDVISDCLTRFPLAETSLSFNGGKDCTVLVHILCAVLIKQYSSMASQTNGMQHMTNGSVHLNPVPVNTLYVKCNSPFQQVEDFIQVCSKYYQLKIDVIEDGMKGALATYVGLHPEVKAVIVGTRRADPHGGKLEFFQLTDPSWPSVMRVHPIIDWQYADIWAFLQSDQLGGGRGVPFCSLYREGYTSLGSTLNTFRNPHLRTLENGKESWQPAWILENEAYERAGRDGPPQMEGNSTFKSP